MRVKAGGTHSNHRALCDQSTDETSLFVGNQQFHHRTQISVKQIQRGVAWSHSAVLWRHQTLCTLVYTTGTLVTCCLVTSLNTVHFSVHDRHFGHSAPLKFFTCLKVLWQYILWQYILCQYILWQYILWHILLISRNERNITGVYLDYCHRHWVFKHDVSKAKRLSSWGEPQF